MKMKKEAVIAAIAFAAAINLSACVYGPPEDYEDTTQPEEETSYDHADNINEDVNDLPTDQ